MMKIDQDILDRCRGDMTAYTNWVAFANFICDMIEKYGDEVLAELDEKERQGKLTLNDIAGNENGDC